MKTINMIDLFAGIGGFSKGFQQAGYTIENHYFSEIDKHAIACYKYNFKNATNVGSIENVRGKDLGKIDVVTFGSPCQDFSLAGRRKGLEGDRSSLITEAIRLISEIRPSVFIWENVKGTFSSNAGADFWAILQAFTNIGGYRLEWQLLNTKWLLPQNRERIYLIGHLDGFSRPGVFPIEENDRLSSTKNRTETGWKQTEDSTTLRAGGMKATDTFIEVPNIAGTLTAGGNSGGLHSDMTTIEIGAFRGRNPEDPTARVVGQPHVQMLEINKNGVSNTLSSVQKDNVVIGTWRTHKDGKGFSKIKDNNCPTLPARAREDGSGQPVIESNSYLRRLTEIECERLQGFPDDWTACGYYEGKLKEIPKTQRYKMLGNAVTVDVVEAVAKRLKLTKTEKYELH